LSDPALLARTVSNALGLADAAANLQTERLVDFVRYKSLLLVLDNFEHLLAGGPPQVASWLASSPRLQVLVTSRSALRVRGERLFPVAPLTLPPVTPPTRSGRTGAVEIAGFPSVALFVERAQEIDPSFQLTSANSPMVAQLCRQMDGLPMAIELAAAHSARLSPELVLERLQRRLDVVRMGLRDLPDHQQTLRAAIAWSYDLLDNAQRLLFARMSVFAGGATMDALEAVCNAREDLEGGLDLALDGLLQQSLVYRTAVEGEEDARASKRFNMLEMLREYGAEMLAESEKEEERASLRRFHAEYYLAMAEAADLHKATALHGLWLDRLERDHDNLRSSIQWALDSGEADLAAGLCAALMNFWRVRGHIDEGRDWLGKVLALSKDISPINLARVLNGAGVLARVQGDYKVAISLHEQSLSIFKGLADKSGIAQISNNLAVDLHYAGDVGKAEELYIESLELRRELGDKSEMSGPLHNLGLLALDRDDYQGALGYFSESLEISRAKRNKDGICSSLYNIGLVLTELPGADADDIERCFTETLTLARELGNKGMVAVSLAKLGEFALLSGDEAGNMDAIALLEDSLALSRQLGEKATVAYTLNSLGYAMLCIEDREKAESLFNESLHLSISLGDTAKIAMNLTALAVAHSEAALAATNREAARVKAGRAAQLYAAAGSLYAASPTPIRLRYAHTTTDALLTILGEDEFEALKRLGQQMSLDEAIAFA
jgi:non-specific serine/threonine protein kinase